MRHRSVALRLAAWLLGVTIAGCGGGAEVPVAMIPSANPAAVARDVRVPAARSAANAAFAVERFGGYEGDHFYARRSGSTFEYSENVAVRFTQPLATKTFSYTIEPAAPSSVYFGHDYLRTAEITVRKVPGTTYTLTIPAGIEDAAGDVLKEAVTETFTTPPEPRAQKPSRRTSGEPYRYGVLEHPFPSSLSAPNGAEQVATIAGAGARFVRIDYCGAQSEPSSEGSFDFSAEDAIADRLAASGITELPLIDQYCAPAWAAGGFTAGTAMWSTPAQYARFAAAVAAHVALEHPRIARMELFNEPNLAGWWNAPAPYADTTGGAAATYMLAAYAAVKAAAPAMTIVGPALSDGGTDVVDPRTFLQNMYAAGCKTGRCWDVLSVHNYAWMNPTFATLAYLPATAYNRFDIYKDLQAIAVANGEAAKPHVMFTEWGISTDTSSPSGFDPAVQARYLSIAFEKMNADPTIDGLVYTNIYNPASDFFSTMALTDASFNPLPGYAVYKMFATH